MARRGPETQLSRKVLDRLKKHYGCEAIKIHGSAYGVAGEPDVEACLAGRMIKIELKVAGNTPTAAQWGRLRAWARAGALVGWITNLDQLDELMAHHGELSWQNPQLDRQRPATVIDGG